MGETVNESSAFDQEKLRTAQRSYQPMRSFLAAEELAGANDALNVSALVERAWQEIRAYRHGDPSNGAYGLELLRRGIIQDDQDAWAGLQQLLDETVLAWLHIHPCREVACRLESEEYYVALAFERFWQATSQQQVAFRTFAGALVYLRASLHGALLDSLRAFSRPKEVPLPSSGELGELQVEDQNDSSEAWDAIKTLLPNGRERRLAYLLYHCGLKPREIVRFCSPEWTDIREIYRLRRNILERLQRNADRLRWRLTH